MPATEMTDELKRDLRVIQLRSVLDPKRFYKKDKKLLSTGDGASKQFIQIGTIVDSPMDFHERLTKRERRQRIVDELLADTEKQSYFQKKFKEIQHQRRRENGKQRNKNRGKFSGKKSVGK